MNCRTTQASFDGRLDGRLDAGDQQQFDSHIAGCAGCRAEWEAYAALWQTLASHETVEPSFGFADRTIRRLNEPEPVSIFARWRPAIPRWATAATLAFAVSVGTWAGWRHHQQVSQAQIYVSVQEANFLGDDFDVIASLDQLDSGNKL